MSRPDHQRIQSLAKARDRYKNDPEYRSIKIKSVREYGRKNSKKIIARVAAWHAEHKDDPVYKEKRRKRIAEWRSRNPDKCAAYEAKLDKERERLRSAAYRLNNPEKRRATTAQYKAARRAWIMENGGKLSRNIVTTLMAEQSRQCAGCFSFLDKAGYHLDHIMPLSRGGLNDDSNVQLLCPPCNLFKGAKHPMEFWRAKGLLPDSTTVSRG